MRRPRLNHPASAPSNARMRARLVGGSCSLIVGAGLMVVTTLTEPVTLAASSGDMWVTDGSSTKPGHATEPHLVCGAVYIWAQSLSDSSGTWVIDRIPPTGSDTPLVNGTWTYSGDQAALLATVTCDALHTAAQALDPSLPADASLHLSLHLSDETKTKTFWVDTAGSTTSSSSTTTSSSDVSTSSTTSVVTTSTEVATTTTTDGGGTSSATSTGTATTTTGVSGTSTSTGASSETATSTTVAVTTSTTVGSTSSDPTGSTTSTTVSSPSGDPAGSTTTTASTSSTTSAGDPGDGGLPGTTSSSTVSQPATSADTTGALDTAHGQVLGTTTAPDTGAVNDRMRAGLAVLLIGVLLVLTTLPAPLWRRLRGTA